MFLDAEEGANERNLSDCCSDDDIDDLETILYGQVHFASALNVDISKNERPAGKTDSECPNGDKEQEEITITEEPIIPEVLVEDQWAHFVLGREKDNCALNEESQKKVEWHVDEFDGDTKAAPQKYPRYYTSNIGKLPEIYCYNCDKKGHLGRDCTNKKKIPSCYLCGEKGHIRSSCQNDLCYNCMDVGHISKDCRKRKKKFAKQRPCKRCKLQGHISESNTMHECTEIWRQYHITVEDGSIKQPKKTKKTEENKDRYCYNCASTKHFGHRCLQDRYSKRLVFSPFIVNYDKCQEIDNVDITYKEQVKSQMEHQLKTQKKKKKKKKGKHSTDMTNKENKTNNKSSSGDILRKETMTKRDIKEGKVRKSGASNTNGHGSNKKSNSRDNKSSENKSSVLVDKANEIIAATSEKMKKNKKKKKKGSKCKENIEKISQSFVVKEVTPDNQLKKDTPEEESKDRIKNCRKPEENLVSLTDSKRSKKLKKKVLAKEQVKVKTKKSCMNSIIESGEHGQQGADHKPEETPKSRKRKISLNPWISEEGSMSALSEQNNSWSLADHLGITDNSGHQLESEKKKQKRNFETGEEFIVVDEILDESENEIENKNSKVNNRSAPSPTEWEMKESALIKLEKKNTTPKSSITENYDFVPTEKNEKKESKGGSYDESGSETESKKTEKVLGIKSLTPSRMDSTSRTSLKIENEKTTAKNSKTNDRDFIPLEKVEKIESMKNMQKQPRSDRDNGKRNSNSSSTSRNATALESKENATLSFEKSKAATKNLFAENCDFVSLGKNEKVENSEKRNQRKASRVVVEKEISRKQKKSWRREDDLDYITLSKLEKILQSDEESDAGYKENTTKNISSPEINLSVNESVNPESVSQKSSSPRTKGNMASADPSCYQIDYTRYDPCEVKLEGLEDYGLVGGTKKFPDSSTPVPNNGQPKMITKDGVRFQWNPYRRQYVDYNKKEAKKKKNREKKDRLKLEQAMRKANEKKLHEASIKTSRGVQQHFGPRYRPQTVPQYVSPLHRPPLPPNRIPRGFTFNNYGFPFQ